MFYKDLPEITEKQTEIMELVFRFRFINKSQIQRLLHHKDARRVNAWLKDLTEKKYLGRIYSHKLLENTRPAIYYLENYGVLWVKVRKGEELNAGYELDGKWVKKFYKDKQASEIFIHHWTTLAEFYVQLVEREKEKQLLYDCETKTELWLQMQTTGKLEEVGEYLPDMFIERTKDDEELSDLAEFMLELFDAGVPSYAMRYRVNQYFKLHEGDEWKGFGSLFGKFPHILLVFPNKQKQQRISRYIREQLEAAYDVSDMLFELTTEQQVAEKGIFGAIWEKVKETEES